MKKLVKENLEQATNYNIEINDKVCVEGIIIDSYVTPNPVNMNYHMKGTTNIKFYVVEFPNGETVHLTANSLKKN